MADGGIEERLRQIAGSARRDRSGLAVLFVSFDAFKEINEAYGRASGDETILEASARIRAAVSRNAWVGRFGGDEFVIVLPDAGRSDAAEAAAAAVQQALRRSFAVGERRIEIASSIGIARFPDDGASADALIDAANAAAHRAKRDGGNAIRFFSREFADDARSRRLLHDDLVAALEKDEFFLHYQPIVDMVRGELRSVEALVRWNSPQRGIVAPGEFIPYLEQSELIVPVGRRIVEIVARQASAWRDEGTPTRVAINVSSRQLGAPEFYEHLTAALDAARVPFADVELEVTESAAMTDTERAHEVLARCRRAGFTIALDDFGTYYSSLSYLKRLPVSTVKIDGSFVRGLPFSDDDAAIVGGVIALAKSLERHLVAEGVETPEQLAWLVRAGCTRIQGYLLGKPMAASEVLRWRLPRGLDTLVPSSLRGA